MSTSFGLPSLLTLVVEHLFSKMRSRNPTPTVLEYSQLFDPTMKENLKQLTECGFHYYTNSASFYELPDGSTLQFSNIPKIPKISTVKMSNENQRLLRDWRDNYGQPVRQVTVRNQSTKDNVGTLPLYSYTKPQPTPNPLLFAEPAVPISWQDRRRSNCILYSAATVLAINTSISGVAESVIPAPFYLGVPAADIVQDQQMTHLPNIHIFVPSEQNTYMFVKKQQGNIPKEAVGLVLQTTDSISQ